MKNNNGKYIELNDIDCFLGREISLAMKLFVSVLFSLCMLSLIWCVLGKVDMNVTAKGILKTNEDNYIIKNLINGEIIAKNISHGDIVTKNQLLFKLDTRLIERELYAEELKKHQLENDLEDIVLFENILKSEINSISIDKAAYLRAATYISELNKLKIELTQSKEKYEQEKNKPSEIIIPVVVRERYLLMKANENEIDRYRMSINYQVQGEKNKIIHDIAIVKNNIAMLEKNIEYSFVRSPINGVLELLKDCNVGLYLFSGEEIARIIPSSDQGLKMELIVSSKDVAEISAGMKYYIYFDSISLFEFGRIHGFIITVPADITVKNDGTAEYLFYGSISKKEVMNKNRYVVSMKPGMSAECKIVIRRKRIISLIIEKLDFLQKI